MADTRKPFLPATKPTVPPKPKNLIKPSIPPKPTKLLQQAYLIKRKPIENGAHGSIESKVDEIREETIVSITSGCTVASAVTSLKITSADEHSRVERSNGYMQYNDRTSVNGVDSFHSSSTNSICSEDDSMKRSSFDETDILEKLSDGYGSDRSPSPCPLTHSVKLSVPQSDAFYNFNNQIIESDFGVPPTNTNSDESNRNSSSSDDITCDNKRKNKIHNIAKEVMTSEKVFCDVLKLLNDEFRIFLSEQGCVSPSSAHGSTIGRSCQNITQDELNRILNYLPQLQNFSEDFLEDMKERLADWDQHNKIADIIVTKGPFLKMYSSYIRDFEHQCSLLDDACAKHPNFAKAVANFEASSICRKLSLKHYMLKPVQRIPQYRLLFQSYVQLLPPDHPDLEDAGKALTILEEVAAHANDTIKSEDNLSELLALQRRLYRSDGGQPELIKPGREVLKQGELMKLCRREMQPRYFVLLSDVLLYTSYSSSAGSAMLRLNTELPLEGMRVSRPIADDFSAELTIRATQRSFTLQARSETERDEWLSSIQEAIDANILRRSTFLMASTSAFSAPKTYDLGKQAPVWIPDYRVSMCQLCTAEFSLTFRRHHCRACGKVVCDLCSSNRAPLEYKNHHPERVCDHCYEALYSALQERITSRDSEEGVGRPEEGFKEECGEKKLLRKELSLNELRKLKVQFKKGIRDSMRGKTLKKPERLREVTANDSGSQMRGYLKRFGRRGAPRTGWFVLKERVLYQYAAPEDVCALESLPVLGYTLSAENFERGVDFSFTLKHPNQEDINFAAETEELVLKWVAAMKDATVL